jgi:Concanavalin A-like lectin/glucanases superfamily
LKSVNRQEETNLNSDRMSLRLYVRLVLGALLFVAAGAAFSQPYGAWLTNNAGHSYVQLPATSALNFAGGSFTFEAWVSLKDPVGVCSSIAGNSFTQSSWIGVCGTTLRSYFQGYPAGTQFDGGVVPINNWTHIAVTFDAATKKHSHYIDGELVAQRTDTDGIAASTAAWRIYSDFSYAHTPDGAIDEVRFWNVARTLAQIRSTINVEIDAPTPGLVALYEFDGDATDAIGTAHGTKTGTTANYLNAAVATGCTTSTSTLCLGPSGRFAVVASYKTASASGNASVVPFSTSESGLFTFFSPTNWEAVVKVINGCGLTSHWWVFAGGLTDQHVELEVSDLPHGVTKRYFNYAGVPFAPITDVNAIATCP